MKQLTLSLEEEINILKKYRLTSSELMLIRTLLIYQDRDDSDLLINYIEALKSCGIQLRDMLITLQNKEVILKSWKCPKTGESLDPHSIQINKNFVKNLYKSSFELGEDLFREYPQFASINGTMVSLRGVSKHFNSLEEAYFKYGKAIRWSEEKHNEIIELVRWAADNDLLRCSLSSFIINHGWEDLQALKNGDKVNINYESIKLL